MTRKRNDSMPRVEIAAVIFLVLVLIFSLSKWKEKDEVKVSGPDPVVIEHINGHVQFIDGKFYVVIAGSQLLFEMHVTNIHEFADKILQSWIYRHILSIHLQRVPKDADGNFYKIISAEFCLLG